MGNKFSHGMTLVELVVAVAILGVVLLAIQVIGDVSRDRLMTSDRKVRTQNEATFIVDHMSRHLKRAIGSNAFPLQGVELIADNSIRVRKDENDDGIPNDTSATSWLAYRYNAATHELAYSQNCQPAGSAWPAGGQIISNKVEVFRVSYNQLSNFVNLEVTTCHNPNWTDINPDSATPACGVSSSNPTITMRTRVSLPQISGGPNN